MMKKEIYYRIREKLKELLKDSEYYHKTYCVGGCVRDLMLGSEIKDIDLVVEIPGGGIGLSKYLYDSDALLYPPVVYENFGTTSFRLKDFPEYELEAVQTRSEEYISRESRNPLVGYGDLDKDWRRRDFTINALYHPISEDRVLDLSLMGLQDLRNSIIRTTSDPQVIFDDDPLRILRCIRFSVRFGWKIEESTWEGVCKNSGRLNIITKERISSEFEKILTSPNPKEGLSLLYTSGSLKFVSEKLYKMTEMNQNKYHIGTVWDHTLEVVNKCKGKDLVTLWSALLHDSGKLVTRIVDLSGGVHFIGHADESPKITEEIMRELKLPVDLIKEVKILVARHMDFKSYAPRIPKDKKLRKLQYILGEKQYWRLLDLIEADNLSHAPGYCIEKQIEEVRERTKTMKTMFNYSLPVSGADIMKVRKIGPSKLVKGYLEYLLKLAFVNPDLSREEMLKRLKNLSPKYLGKEYADLD